MRSSLLFDDSARIEPATLGWGRPGRGAEMEESGGEEEDAPEDYDERELSVGLRFLFDLFIVKLIV